MAANPIQNQITEYALKDCEIVRPLASQPPEQITTEQAVMVQSGGERVERSGAPPLWLRTQAERRFEASGLPPIELSPA